MFYFCVCYWLLNTCLYVISQRIVQLSSELGASRKWQGENFIPFCGDESGLLAINASTGEVTEWDSSDGYGDCISGSFPGFLENFRDSLLAGRVEYLDGIGVVEKVSAAPRRK